MRVLIVLVVALVHSVAWGCMDVEERDLSAHFQGLSGSFALASLDEGWFVVHGVEDAMRPHLPASTFKIPATLIALETAVAAVDEVRERDPALAPAQDWWPRTWLQPHAMATGFQASAVWLYQSLARDVGEARMRDWLQRLEYGNGSIDGGVDRFWLDGGLAISTLEQVDFLSRLHWGELPVSDASRRAVLDLMLIDRGPEWRLLGKTGWSGTGDGTTPGVGWLVGYVESAQDTHAFALRIDVVEGTDPGVRLRILRSILGELGLDGGGPGAG